MMGILSVCNLGNTRRLRSGSNEVLPSNHRHWPEGLEWKHCPRAPVRQPRGSLQ